ncbi:TonB-dependent receptor domain-containing protein [Flavobacterium selenitireducens]|uniref:TonB-dependent receptor domain-containing protein n=1 Tax=Flavobacterium selenitireducens TaxID=2722704 RepID=UPI00168A8F7F|nr:TonB-dependent receptor [Flavobacterium selenitireducens]MBD3582432.1 TonB-dependent receptor [Flavobacterium selenitireducens]
MKIKLLLVCFLATLFSAHAQNSAGITGKVVDKATGAPLSYVSVSVKFDGKVATGAITDDSGNFDIPKLEPKTYQLEVQFMGYKTHSQEVSPPAGQKVALGTISLSEDAVQLKEVNIVAERSTIEQKIDRKVINVGKDLTTAGATASEIMNNIPSVNVDQDGKISLRGNENVRILVDGRPTNTDAATLLKQIPSTSIKKIELITNPSAKYNPEGMSGIINIVLHKNANDGFNASLNSGVTVARTPKINNSMNWNYRTGKVNFFGTYGNHFGNYANTGDIRRLDNGTRQQLEVKNRNGSNLAKFGIDYYLNDKNTISVYTNQNFYNGGTSIVTDISSFNALEAQVQQADYRDKNHEGAYNIAYKKLFDKEGRTLDIELNHNAAKGDQDADYYTEYDAEEIPDFQFKDATLNHRQLTTVNVDFVNPIGEKSTLELGAEARFNRSQNDYKSNFLSSAYYYYNFDIYSAYATFGQRLGKFSYQLGARFESYKVEAILNREKAYEDDYITLYPSASATYSPNEKDMFQLSYSRRVDRPGLDQTSPIREFATPLVTGIGNPELDPQFTNSVELNYTRKLEKGSLSTGVFVRNIQDEINRILYPDPENPNKQIMTYDNFDNNTAFGFEISANYKITSWWDVQPAVDFSSINQQGLVSRRIGETDEFELYTRKVTFAALNARMNSNFKATKQLSFLLFGFYRSGTEGIQMNPRSMWKADMGARYSMLDNKLTVSVRWNDMFHTQRFRFTSDNPYPQTGQFAWESQSVYVGMNYAFGAGKNRAMERKQREDNTKQGGGMF